MNGCCLTPSDKFSALSWREQVPYVIFVQDQHVPLDMYNAGSPWQHANPLGHIIPNPSQPVCSFCLMCRFR